MANHNVLWLLFASGIRSLRAMEACTDLPTNHHAGKEITCCRVLGSWFLQ